MTYKKATAPANERRKLDNENVRFYETKSVRIFYRAIHPHLYYERYFRMVSFMMNCTFFASRSEKIYINKLHVRFMQMLK